MWKRSVTYTGLEIHYACTRVPMVCQKNTRGKFCLNVNFYLLLLMMPLLVAPKLIEEKRLGDCFFHLYFCWKTYFLFVCYENFLLCFLEVRIALRNHQSLPRANAIFQRKNNKKKIPIYCVFFFLFLSK